jgi:hypothetical protein
MGDAVIAEPRALRRLPGVLLNVVQQIPRSWTVHLLHGDSNAARVRDAAALRPALSSGRLRLRHLRTVGVNIDPAASHTAVTHRWYNTMLLSHPFWASFSGDSRHADAL